VNLKLFRGFATTAAVREGHLDILEVLLKAGASQPACEEALMEASSHGRASFVELLMGSDLIRPHVALHAFVTACGRGFTDVVESMIKVVYYFLCMPHAILCSEMILSFFLISTHDLHPRKHLTVSN